MARLVPQAETTAANLARVLRLHTLPSNPWEPHQRAVAARRLLEELGVRCDESAALLALAALGAEKEKGSGSMALLGDVLGGAAAGRIMLPIARGRLLVLDTGRAEIAHDVLLQAWPRLRGWLAEDETSMILYGQLAEDAAQWRSSGGDRTLLYRGVQLTATAQAARRAGTLMMAVTVATRTLEEIAQAAGGSNAALWFQLYVYPSLEVAAQLVRRAEAAGYRAIVLTVDLPRLGNRERDRRNNVAIPPPPFEEANLTGIARIGQAWVPLTWDSIAWLRSVTALPILLKGILTAEDARLAVEHGVAGIIVTNHGGRQLDTAIPSIEALPEIVEAVEGRCEVYLDGGIRRGTDILKALALGARAVLIGRPVLWGLAVNGTEGVYLVLELLRRELELSMALSGRPTLASIDRSLVRL